MVVSVRLFLARRVQYTRCANDCNLFAVEIPASIPTISGERSNYWLK